jgi:hypothetical protein
MQQKEVYRLQKVLCWLQTIFFFLLQHKLDNKNAPQSTGDRPCKCCPGGVYGSYERNARINFRWG